MADVMRYRHGDTNPVVSPACNSGLLYEIGDLIYQASSGQIFPASSQPDQGAEAVNQELFACRFLGVAMQRSLIGEILPIRVATTGVFEFICLAVGAGGWVLGSRLAPDENAAGTALLDQTVAFVVADNMAIGRVNRIASAGDLTVLCRIRSEIMEGGIDPGTCESSSSSPV